MRSIVILGIGSALLACTIVAPDASGVSASTTGSDHRDGGERGPDLAPGARPTPEPLAVDGGTNDAAVAGNWLHTSGSKILDTQNQVVRLTGVSWFGLETTTFAPHGLHVRKLGDMLDQIKGVGFNVIRLPFSNQLFDTNATPNGIDFNLNPDLVGLTGLQIMDKVISGAKARGLKVLLDRHRPTAAGQSALWYTPEISEQRWIDDWKMLATRYRADPTVIGADLHNEPHANATWGDGNASTDWRLAAEKAGNAILSVGSSWLVIVEGVEVQATQYYWWGGNLRGAAASPVRLTRGDRVVYSPHDYPSSIYAQSWFSAPTYPANLATVWTDTWGYLATQGTAPVLVGEFGSRLQTASDKQWLTALATFIKQNGLSFTFWAWNPDSGDTGGILSDDWKTPIAEKVAAITPALAPPIP